MTNPDVEVVRDVLEAEKKAHGDYSAYSETAATLETALAALDRIEAESLMWAADRRNLEAENERLRAVLKKLLSLVDIWLPQSGPGRMGWEAVAHVARTALEGSEP